MSKNFFTVLLIALGSTLMFAACGSTASDLPATSDDAPSDDSIPVTTYEITWKDENGNILTTTEIEEGKTPSYVYEKVDTAEWDYTVLGWSITQDGEVLSSIPAATSNTTYYAKISQEKQVYTITYMSEDKAIDSVTLEYGSVLEEFPTPEQEGYKFVGWCEDKELKNEAQAPLTVVGDKTLYAKWNKKIELGALLEKLLSDYELNPMSYIPETMTGKYSANLVNPNEIITDYSSNVSVSNMLVGGFGEQWNMVLDNLNQSAVFFNTLTVVEALTTSSITAFNNYLDSNTSDTAHHNFASGIYSVTIDFDGETLIYVLDYTANIPLLGEQAVQIFLSMDIQSEHKQVRVQLGEPNALAYKLTENGYEFAIKYLGVRRAFFSIEQDEQGNREGHIYEYLTVEGKGISSAADFYITEDYVSVVGNKADAFIGFKGYIDEIYSVETGKMLGYEIRETLSKIVYNTLWFNLDQISGINSIRYKEATESDEAAFYVNGASTAWKNKKVGSGLKILSRRFDIEFRTQYFYSYDSATKEYTKHMVQVPMFFVQEENFETLTADVKAVNNITVLVTLDNADLLKIQDDYAQYIDVFIANKELVTEEIIVAYIGEKILFQ